MTDQNQRTDQNHVRAAELLADYCLDVKRGDRVIITSTTAAAGLVREVGNALLERGAWPLLRLTPPEFPRDLHAHAQDWMLDGQDDLTLVETGGALSSREYDTASSSLRIAASTDTRALQDVDAQSGTRLRRSNQAVLRSRLARRWCVTLFPTAAYARDAGMSLPDFERFVWDAMLLGLPDPARGWQELERRQARLIERLSLAREVRIEGPGTDLRLRVDGRTWVNSAGHRNMPSGEVFTGPLEDSAEGRVRFTIPSTVNGVDVEGVELEFRAGRVVSARADVGDAYLQRALETDAGARLLGEIGIGTNDGIQRATRNILFDEKIGGTVHLALGNSYLETGGTNVSALHWDLITDLRASAGGGSITLDGEVFQQDGVFAV